jgi:NAD(P)-dependent dehydrogenase (short-subunit alcohol dehydrogenase family)
MKLQQLFDLSGRRALVTGGNSGIGEAMARALGLAGAKVLLMARRQPELDAAAARLQAEGIATITQAANLADAAAARDAALAAEASLGGVDILVNAAGVNLRQPFLQVTP